ncbi:serine protease [Streptomyces sp. NBC_01551]|uniref:nSTAND1 domain-containing NTPase n=1 Tax=Streptomyces sp. NBC_01551 TaxID=2975876 RepID=UPI002B1CBC6C|nr:AAA family ATPase [Streptomyces sp. NBC_01551]MCX4529864.1 serine protease [Streptomyces sp. NBC_01551]
MADVAREPNRATTGATGSTGSAGAAAVSPLGAAVARVWGRNGRPIGGAFLAAPDRLLTCAHVVNMALGRDGESTSRPSEPVTLDFPLVAPGVRVTAEVEHWVPPGRTPPEDVAGLRLTASPPSAATAAALINAPETFDLRGVVLGFPELSDSGVWSIGRLRGRQARGWVQIDVDGTSQFDIRKGFSGVPVWDPERAAAVGMVVTAWRGSGIRSAYMVPTAGLFEAWPRLRSMAQPPTPFPGLRPFSEAEADVFFGRDGLSGQIVRRSRVAPVVTVIGPSGVGKSSLVRAGVLPRLRAEPGTVVVSMRPSEARTPLRSLAFALDRALAGERANGTTADSDAVQRLDRVTELAERIARDGLREITGAVLEARGAERLLIFVDQLEEVFAASDQAADDFAAALRSAVPASGAGTDGNAPVAWADSPVRLLCALRADFLGSALKRPLLGFLVDGERLLTVGELDDAELRQALLGPIGKLCTVTYEEGLVNRIMDEVGHAPGRLPLVQFTLSQLWERQRNGLLTHESYDDLGGVQNALADHAEHIWSGLDTDEQTLAARLLNQLVHPLPDRMAFTRRSAARADFGDETWALAGRLATSRVVVVREVADLPRSAAGADRDEGGVADEQSRLGVELAHESLITRWDRLHQLTLRERDFRIWQDGLRQRIEAWYGEGCPKRRLLPLSEAREARRWLRTHADEMGREEHRYLAGSRRRHRALGLRAAAVVTVLAVVGTSVWRDQQEKLAHSAAHSLAEGAAKLAYRDAYGEARLALRARDTAVTEETNDRVRNSYAALQSADVLLPDPSSALSDTASTSGDGVMSVRNQLSADGRTVALTAPDLKPAVWRIAEDGRSAKQVSLGLLDPVMQGNRPAIDASGRYAAFITPMSPAITSKFKKNPCRPPDPTAIALTTCLTVFDTGSGRATVVVPVKGIARAASVEAMSIDPSAKVIGLMLKTANDTWELQRRDLATGRLLTETSLRWESYMGLRLLTGFWLAPGGESALVMTTGEGGKKPYVRHELRNIPLTEAAGAGGAANAEGKVLTPYAVNGAVTVSGDGTRIAATLSPSDTEWGTEFKVWDVRTGAVVAQLPGLSDSLGSTRITLDRTGKRLFAMGLDNLGKQYPEFPPIDVANTDAMTKAVEELEEKTATRVWVWRVGGQEEPQQSVMRLSSGWLSVRALGDGPDAHLALYARGAIGFVGSQEGKLPEQRLTHRPANLTSIDPGTAVPHLCSALATSVESGTVGKLTPDGAATGDPCD